MPRQSRGDQPVPQVTAGHRHRGAEAFCHGTRFITLDVANAAALKEEKSYRGHKATASNPASWSRKTENQAFGKAAVTTALQTL